MNLLFAREARPAAPSQLGFPGFRSDRFGGLGMCLYKPDDSEIPAKAALGEG